MYNYRLLSVAIALILVVSMCLGPAGAVPANNDLPYGIVYGDVDVTWLGVEEIVRYDSFSLVRGYVQPAEVLSFGGIYQPLLDRTTIYLRSGPIDTTRPLSAPVDLRYASDNLQLVQLIGPVKAEWVENLAVYGEVLDYIPNFAFIMAVDVKTVAALLRLDFVRWVGPYMPAYRIAPDVLAGHVDEATVVFYGKANVSELSKELTVVRTMNNAVTVTGSPSALRQAARLPGVAFIEAHSTPEFLNNMARVVIRADHPHNNSVVAEGQIGAVTDTGVHWEHEAFNQNQKLLAYIDYCGDAWQPGVGGDGYGHGSHCAGSMLGNAPPYNMYNSYDGQGFGARLISVKTGTNGGAWALNTDFYTMWKTPYCVGARVNTNSWGSFVPGTYPAVSNVADQICWDHRNYVLTVAAGNAGGSGPGWVSAPATAKNVIAVGASERLLPENVAIFSSRGPTADNRIKPDVMAPGVDIMSPLTGTTNGYFAASGTSMATPQVAGAALLVRDYFMRGFYPTGIARPEHEFEPSSALVKAVLINGAEEMTGLRSDWNNEGVWPNNAQGWGRINLERSLYFRYDDRRIRVWDSPAELATGQAWGTYYFIPECATDVKFTLAWTDYPAAAGSGVTLRNDLDLQLVSPDGTVYLGNNFQGINPGYSVPNGAVDDRNTVEGIHLVRNLSPMVSGLWRVEVIGANVPAKPQDFALVISQECDPCAPELMAIAVIGDFKHHLTDYISARGFFAAPYRPHEYRDVMAGLDHISVILINKAENSDDFDILLEEAHLRNRGVIFLSQEPNADFGLGVLSDRTGDPTTVIDDQNVLDLTVIVGQVHPILAGYQPGQVVQLTMGGPGYFQVFQSYSGDILAYYQQPTRETIAATDYAATGEGRHVLLASLGIGPLMDTQFWTADAEAVLINSIEWARDQL